MKSIAATSLRNTKGKHKSKFFVKKASADVMHLGNDLEVEISGVDLKEFEEEKEEVGRELETAAGVLNEELRGKTPKLKTNAPRRKSGVGGGARSRAPSLTARLSNMQKEHQVSEF
jgi:hypothetical protein